ncbi:MAG TPA: hypothetical protein VGQ83_11610 [Polyangia bacterium]|jgi:hypothetical protein
MPVPPPPKPQKGPPPLKTRIQDMWDLGLKNSAWVIPVIGAVVVFLLYTWDILKEGFVGALVALTLALGPLALAIPNAVSQTKSPKAKYLIYALGVVWLIGLGFPVYHSLFPPKAVAERTLEKGKPAIVDVGRSRRLELVARGGFPGEAAGSGSYKISVASGSVNESVSGTFERTWQNVRVGRRGGTARQLSLHLVNLHELPMSVGPQVTLKIEELDDSLQKQVIVGLRPAGLPTWLFFALAGVVILAAMVGDLWFEARKEKAHTYLFIAAVFGAVFAGLYPSNVSQNLVRGAIGAGIQAILAAGIGGFFVIWLARTILLGKRRAPVKVKGKG